MPKLSPERPTRRPRPLAWWQNGMHADARPCREGQGLPHRTLERGRGDRVHVVGHTLPVQRFLHPQLQLLLWRQLGLGKGEKRRERGWVSGAPTTYLIQEPGSCGGAWGGGTGRGCPPQGSGKPGDGWSPAGQRGGEGDADLTGQSIPSPLRPQGWISRPPPGPPCRPTGPSSRALLLAGIRRASSKFLLTLAAPVSLPAAGSVLRGGKDGCHL